VPNLAKALLALWLLLCGAAQGKSMHTAGPPPGNFFAKPAGAIRETPPPARIRITIIVWTAWKCASDCTYCHNDPINKVDVLGAAQVMLSRPEPLPEKRLEAALWWLFAHRADIFSGKRGLIFARPGGGYMGSKPAAFESVVGMEISDFLVETGMGEEQARKMARLYLPFAHAQWEELEVRERWARDENIAFTAKMDADPLVRANRVADDFRTAFWSMTGDSVFVALGGSHYTPWIEDPGLAWQEASGGERLLATVDLFSYVAPLARGGKLGQIGKVPHSPHVPRNLIGGNRGPLAGSIRTVNPNFPASGFNQNCVNCVIATEHRFAGLTGATALSSTGPLPISNIAGEFGGSFQNVSGMMEIGSILSRSGNGARGIVFGADSARGFGHVWNVRIDNGVVRFLDSQPAGRAGLGVDNFDDFTDFQFLLTSPGR
jgi:hypothetical protein